MHPEKFFLPVLIPDQSESLPVSWLGQKEYAIALEVDMATGKMNKKLLEMLVKGDSPFLLLLKNTDAPETGSFSATAELISLALFGRNYIRQEGNPVLAFMQPEQEPDTGEGRRSLITYLNLQGWPEITKWMLPEAAFSEQVISGMSPPLLLSSIDFSKELLLNKFFTNVSYMGNYLFFMGGTAAASLRLEEEFARTCVSAMDLNPLFRLYMSHCLVIKKRLERLTTEKIILAERLNNAELTINTIRSKYKDDYDILFKWYQKEYEVLPLWYKRIGHILKVFMGKRTFRSLFVKEMDKKYDKKESI